MRKDENLRHVHYCLSQYKSLVLVSIRGGYKFYQTIPCIIFNLETKQTSVDSITEGKEKYDHFGSYSPQYHEEIPIFNGDHILIIEDNRNANSFLEFQYAPQRREFEPSKQYTFSDKDGEVYLANGQFDHLIPFSTSSGTLMCFDSTKKYAKEYDIDLKDESIVCYERYALVRKTGEGYCIMDLRQGNYFHLEIDPKEYNIHSFNTEWVVCDLNSNYAVEQFFRFEPPLSRATSQTKNIRCIYDFEVGHSGMSHATFIQDGSYICYGGYHHNTIFVNPKRKQVACNFPCRFLPSYWYVGCLIGIIPAGIGYADFSALPKKFQYCTVDLMGKWNEKTILSSDLAKVTNEFWNGSRNIGAAVIRVAANILYMIVGVHTPLLPVNPVSDKLKSQMLEDWPQWVKVPDFAFAQLDHPLTGHRGTIMIFKQTKHPERDDWDWMDLHVNEITNFVNSCQK